MQSSILRRGLLLSAIAVQVALASGCCGTYNRKPKLDALKEDARADGPAAAFQLKVGGYYPGYMQGVLPPQEIDFTALTHVFHFSLWIKSDGSLDEEVNVITPENATPAIQAAHAASKKILLTVGGAKSADGFRAATASEQSTAELVQKVVNHVVSRGYDGVDVDWEPLEEADSSAFKRLMGGLRDALNGKDRRLYLTVAAKEPSIVAQVQDDLDQINVMTYDYVFPYPDSITWHNAPLFPGACKVPGTEDAMPSVKNHLDQFSNAGIAGNKISIGIPFYGYVWSGGETSFGGVTQPCQPFKGLPTAEYTEYSKIMESYHQPQRYSWDDVSQAAYLSINEADTANDRFVTFDDQTSIQKKAAFAKNNGVGVFIWELGGGYRSNQPPGQKDQLLQALKAAFPP